MPTIYHISVFLDRIAQEQSLNPSHISLYFALVKIWASNKFINPISISRNEVMQISKIASRVTYLKCLKKLQLLGYINYKPSFNPYKCSQVYLNFPSAQIINK